ncbi:Transcriptional regulator PadR-like family protein [uncultured archaeon]|nr:Transcriptional regulator PadR-like family protein [uncultured archaeon]
MFKAHIKLRVLHELNKNHLSGYDLMKNIEESGQKTSPGYIYPLLNDLERKKFISVKHKDRKKVYSITGNGKKLLENLRKNREEMFKKMKKTWEAINEKNEFKEFVKSGKNINNFKDQDILIKFHRTLFSVYDKDNKNKREKIREIMNESIKQMKKLK